MQGQKDHSSPGPDLFGYDGDSDTSQRAELLGPDDDEGFYTSQLHDWIPLCPQLRDSGVRLYWIMRALVIEKRGPVRKLTLLQLCHLLPSKQMPAGEAAQPSSLARVRSLLSELSDVGLISTPEGGPIKTSSRAGASAAPLRIRINDRPQRGYAGPRNAFALLDEIRGAAEEAGVRAVRKERERSALKRARRAAGAGQISGPPGDAGQISSPRGQISSPRGQISSPHSGSDLQTPEPPFRPSVKTLRSDRGASVRPSVQVADEHARETDGRTDAGSARAGKVRSRPTSRAAETEAAGTDQGDAHGSDGPRLAREATPGMEVLLRVGRLRPELALAGRVLTDQARKLDGVIAESEAMGAPWRISELASVLSAPLDGPIRKSPGGVISARIGSLPSSARTAMLPGQTARNDSEGTRQLRPVSAADRSVTEAVNRRVRGECPECGADSPGSTVCGGCQGWPSCTGGCGRPLPNGGVCEVCEMAADHAAIEAAPTGDGTCPGHGGKPCGRAVQTLGLCGRCRIQADQARAQRNVEWNGNVAAVSAQVAAETGGALF
ncbi:hypothetical protein [Streptomyces sp. NPDC020298]|uniref:hypothetical protein n=1 Tax=unclassified Streptomyces TaxID=2593676 RepID=UPI003402AA61